MVRFVLICWRRAEVEEVPSGRKEALAHDAREARESGVVVDINGC